MTTSYIPILGLSASNLLARMCIDLTYIVALTVIIMYEWYPCSENVFETCFHILCLMYALSEVIIVLPNFFHTEIET